MEWIYSGWGPIIRTVAVGAATYAVLLAVLRISGKRTLSKLNAFDLVVTVALGSTVATILLNKEVAFTEGIAALVVLVALQFGVAYVSVRSTTVSRLVKSEPALVVRDGQMLHATMRRERVAPAEIEQAARMNGVSRIEDVAAMILETDGSFSVVPQVPQSHRFLERTG